MRQLPLPICKPQPRFAIFDLDGTLACDWWRKHYEMNRRFDDYHSLSVFDPSANKELLEGFDGFFILTGRPEQYRQITNDWLNNHQIFPHILFMRDEPGALGTVEFKRRKLLKIIALSKKIGISITDLFDDREDVCAMADNLGITTHKVSTPRDCIVILPDGLKMP